VDKIGGFMAMTLFYAQYARSMVLATAPTPVSVLTTANSGGAA
jgi:hypothetical protein